jgi:hypothetical protein
MLVSASLDENGSSEFKMQRDAFYRIIPKSEVNKNSIKMSLDKRKANYIIDDNTFIVVGEDALEIAIERHDKAERPLQKGVISPKNKKSLPVIKTLIKTILGESSPGSKVVYSVPAQPVDTDFDIIYHTEIIGSYLKTLGYESSPLNEAFAIALSELLDDGLTGVCISCLVPGTKIYSNKGIVNIEDVKIGDEVITHKGRFRKINNIITKEFKGLCTKVQLQGYSNNTNLYKFVDDHELYVNRNGSWVWVGCEDLKIGDIVGEPIIEQDIGRTKINMTLCERKTNSNEYIKNKIHVGPNIYRLFGYFLGDGSICERSSGIQFDFASHESNNIKDVIDIFEKLFKKKCMIIKKSENCTRIKVYSKGIASWFKNKFYDDENKKIFPWDLSRLSNNDCLNLLAGMIRSDGIINNDSMYFYNTSTNLILTCKQLFSRLGIAASISFRNPRSHHYEKENRDIEGVLCEWCVGTGKKTALNSISNIISDIDCSNSKTADRLFINKGFCCSRVQNIEYEEYSGIVYDLQVEEDHSFSGPYLTIHNCGAGMANICVVHQGDPLIEFSLTKSGDYIDQSVGTALDMSPSLVQQEKEYGVNLLNPAGEIQNAINVYYGTVIKYTLENISYELNRRRKDLPIFREDVPLVLSGGLTLAEGFVEKVENTLKAVNMPLRIGEVRRVDNPMTCVANGCLLAALM